MRELKFRAKFKQLSNGQEYWKFMNMKIDGDFNSFEVVGRLKSNTPTGFVQVSDWEKCAENPEILEG